MIASLRIVCRWGLRSVASALAGQGHFARFMILTAIIATTLSTLGCVSKHSKIMTYHGSSLSKIGWIPNPHDGVDFEDKRGAPVLAVADGVVMAFWSRAETEYRTESLGAIIYHPEHRLYSTYGHLLSARATKGMQVKRGEVIATNGTSGLRKNRVPGSMPAHVHLELRLQAQKNVCNEEMYVWACLGQSVDPLDYDGGCFDPDKNYTDDRFVLTYPVRC